ncbi:hypothetical protein [Elongatibacter sediminis]|uniref:ATP-grasp domain-containing protein n=1 Tax=Elongatibacter sediminis TaxID=3119006 RepID=A0AAW9RCI8_9GAMM
MIIYVCTSAERHVVAAYFGYWGASLRKSVRLVSYKQLFSFSRLPRATYIFADLERLPAWQRERAALYWHHLKKTWPEARLLNHPLRTQRRYSLLRTLNKSGMNGFDVFRLEEDRTPSRFPVFIRRENSHSGPESELLHTPDELDAALRQMTERMAADDLLITEFLNRPDPQGRFWKYSAFVFEDRIVPAHLFVEDAWCVKAPMFVDDEIIAAERDYIEGNPHESHLREVARLGQIEYGRIDYGIVDGQPQVYEINTHPQIVGAFDNHAAARSEARERSARLIESAFRAIDDASAGKESVAPPVVAGPAWWRERSLAYGVCVALSKSIGRPSLAPWFYHQLLRLASFAMSKGLLPDAPSPDVKSQTEDRDSRH